MSKTKSVYISKDEAGVDFDWFESFYRIYNLYIASETDFHYILEGSSENLDEFLQAWEKRKELD